MIKFQGKIASLIMLVCILHPIFSLLLSTTPSFYRQFSMISSTNTIKANHLPRRRPISQISMKIGINNYFKNFLNPILVENTNNKIVMEVYPGVIVQKDTFSEFSKRLPTVPPVQRRFIEERVDEFYEDIMTQYKYSIDNNDQYPVPYLGLLSVGVLNDKYYILDGQHRYRAFEKFSKQSLLSGDSFDIAYFLRRFLTQNELNQYFLELNDNLEQLPSTLDPDFIDPRIRITEYMESKYKQHIKTSENPRFPNINLNQFIEEFCYAQVENRDFNAIKTLIESENIKYGERLKSTHPEYYEMAMKKQGLFLAFALKQPKESQRRGIRKGVRKSLWLLKGKGEISQSSCCNVDVTFDTFEAGHNISYANKGSDSVHNLEILCQSCNRSMGKINLAEYREKYYSNSK